MHISLCMCISKIHIYIYMVNLNMYFTNLHTTEIEGFPSSTTFWGPRLCEAAIISHGILPNHPNLERNVKPPIIMFHVNIFRGVVIPGNHVS